MTKKVYESFSVLPKNLNREILTKNLVTLKEWDVVKDEIFLGGFTKNQYIQRNCQKRGA